MDEAAAKQREIRMFDRRVNGIREQQRRLAEQQGASSTNSEAYIPSSSQDDHKDYPVVLSQDMFGNNAPDASSQHAWNISRMNCPDHSTVISDDDDEWSVTGFDSDEAHVRDATEAEGIFDLDL